MAEIKVMISPVSLFSLYEKLSPLIDWLKKYKAFVKAWKGPKWTALDHKIEGDARRTVAQGKAIIDAWASAYSQCDHIDVLRLISTNEFEPYRAIVGLSWDELKEWTPVQKKWDPYEWQN